MTNTTNSTRPSGPRLLALAPLLVLALALGWMPACGDASVESAAPGAETSAAPSDPTTDLVEPKITDDGLEMTIQVVDPDDAAPEGSTIRGVVELGPEYASHNGTRTLFVIARAATGGPMPRAALRVHNPTFPLAFELGPEQVMLDVENPAEMLEGKLKIYARLDADGSAMAAPGDFESEFIETTVGTSGHVLTINKTR